MAPRTFACLSSSVNSQQLRSQLDQLQQESDRTRSKANNARLRLVRLSEAAEKLRRQAALYARTGNETGARELLFQKKKIIQTMEKSKDRIQLLDELAAKLNEAISIKESQLMGKISSDLEFEGHDETNPVWIISPKQDFPGSADAVDSNISNLNGDGSVGLPDSPTDVSVDNEVQDLVELNSMSLLDRNEILHGLEGISSYKELLEHLDRKFDEIEAELATTLRLSKLMIEEGEEADNSKMQLSLEILEKVRDIRGRIKRFMLKEMEA
ncbi:hypothetical protein Droror1_Dr00017389 [Drosera rotundifolia]